MNIPVDTNTSSQLPFFSVKDLDLVKLSNVNHRQFPPIIQGNFFARFTMIAMRHSRKRTKVPSFKSSFPLGLLPSEILYQIFENAHPIDLYNLARTSRALRTMLLCPYGKGIWKTALAHWRRFLPPQPPGVLEYEWIILLFGPDTCDDCGENKTILHCAFRQRLCEACRRNHFGYAAHYVLGDADLARIVGTLVPGSSYYGRHSHSIRYRSSDIKSMASRVKEFQSAIKAETPGATMLYNEFLASERAYFKAVEEHTHSYNRWIQETHARLNQHYIDRYNRTAEIYLKKLTRLGHDERDLFSAKSAIYALVKGSHILRFSRRNWRTIRPELEFIVKEKATNRVRTLRYEIVKALFLKYRKRRPARTWNHDMEPLYEILKLKFFDQYIHSPDLKLENLRSDIADIAFDDALECWRKRKQHDLAILINPCHKDLSEKDIVKILDFATSIFICNSCYYGKWPLFGWNDVEAHDHVYYGAPFAFSRVGYEAAASIIRLLGLDPELTTASELDKLDARFFCETCPVMLDGRMQGRKALTWRECVLHTTDIEVIKSHGTACWALLTPEAAASVRVHEPPVHPPDKLLWSCNYCAVHYKNFTLRKDAIKHVRDSHSKLHPVSGKDIIFMKQYIRPKVLLLARDTEYFCSHCLPLKKRLRRFQDLCLHLSDKHGVRQPVENEDWVHIKMIEKTWPTQKGVVGDLGPDNT